jgi:hypothetical protein
MRKSIISFPIIAFCIMALFILGSFKPVPSASTSKSLTFDRGEPITFFGVTTPGGGPTYTGTVFATGAINASGTFVMPTELLGQALHCVFILTFPNGTITIRMNCNLVTLNGQWHVLGGTGAYQNLKGGGSLTMPGDDELLTGTVRGIKVN